MPLAAVFSYREAVIAGRYVTIEAMVVSENVNCNW